MRIVFCKWFPPKGFDAITLVWWIVVRDGYKISAHVINHEEIHSKQQKEMLILPFFIWYGLEFLFRLLQYRNWMTAYKNVSFEREAYANQMSRIYVGNRKHFEWIHYLKRK